MDTNYFEFRGVSPEFYDDYQIPIFIRSRIPKTASILDFGCGFGQLLNALRNDGYKSVAGVDITPAAVSHCQSIGIQIFDSLDAVISDGTKFDWIVMSHVLEHIDKDAIILLLNRIRTELLRPDGKFMIMVPNAMSNTDCYWRYEDWTHTLLFTPGSLLYVLRAAGFTSIHFIDPDCTEGSCWYNLIAKKMGLKLYRANRAFWNRITASSYHKPSPQIFSFELKAVASSPLLQD